MGKAIIISLILFVILVGAIIFIYYKYEKPQEENKVYLINLSLFARSNDKLVRTNFTVFANGLYLGNGLTNEYGATLYQVPYNSSIAIVNSNILNQTYYKNRVDLFTDKNETTRVNLDLVSVGNLTINDIKELNKFNVSVFTTDYFKNTVICLDWSIHVIHAEIENMTQITSLENMTKCYQGPTLENSGFNFIINYQTFGIINPEDYIHVNFYDFDEEYKRRQIFVINNI